MIVDDVLAGGLRTAIATGTLAEPQVFRVPYRVAPAWVSTPDGRLNLHYTTDPLVERLIPRAAHNADLCDATWARLPYPSVILASEHAEAGCLVVFSSAGELAPTRERWYSQRWHLLYVVRNPSRRAFLPVCAGSVCVANDGLYRLPDPAGGQMHEYMEMQRGFCRLFGLGGDDLVATSPRDDAQAAQWFRQYGVAAAAVALTTFALLGARNVTTETVVPPPTLQRARAGRGQHPLVTYHVLRVAPFAALRRSPTATPSGALLPIHWVRGHFKVFTAERPLFGRYSGRFWWQPTVHGRDTSRVVVKDYELPAPTTTPDA